MLRYLWIEPPLCRFNFREEQKLKQKLEDLDSNLSLTTIRAYQDVQLSGNAELNIGGAQHRLTKWAMFQLCQLVCPSLHGFVSELSGIYRLPSDDKEDYSFDDCLEIINRVMRRRFTNRLLGKVMLRNTMNNSIDGFVSGSYRYLSNYELYSKVAASMDSLQNQPKFFEGVLNGRWLLLRYIEPKPCISFQGDDDIDERFFSGYHFSNNEVGKASLHGSLMLYRKFSRSAALAADSAREGIRHQGYRFEAKLEQLLQSLPSLQLDPATHRAYLDTLRSTPLCTSSKSDGVNKRKGKDVTNRLVRHGVPLNLANEASGRMVAQSSYDEQAPEFATRTKERTVYDLYNALGRDVDDLPINQRERLEQAAYAILTGKIVFH